MHLTKGDENEKAQARRRRQARLAKVAASNAAGHDAESSGGKVGSERANHTQMDQGRKSTEKRKPAAHKQGGSISAPAAGKTESAEGLRGQANQSAGIVSSAPHVSH